MVLRLPTWHAGGFGRATQPPTTSNSLHSRAHLRSATAQAATEPAAATGAAAAKTQRRGQQHLALRCHQSQGSRCSVRKRRPRYTVAHGHQQIVARQRRRGWDPSGAHVAPQGASAEHTLRKFENQRKTSSPKSIFPGIPTISAPTLQLLIKKAGRISSPECGTGHESGAQPEQEEAQLPWKMLSVLVPSFRAPQPNLQIYKSSSRRNLNSSQNWLAVWG